MEKTKESIENAIDFYEVAIKVIDQKLNDIETGKTKMFGTRKQFSINNARQNRIIFEDRIKLLREEEE